MPWLFGAWLNKSGAFIKQIVACRAILDKQAAPSYNAGNMKDLAGLSPLPPPVLFALRRLNDAGFEAYLVGGCVRDACLGQRPTDFDITTQATPEEMKAALAGEKLLDIGLKHGTLTLVREGMPIEITTYRQDSAYSDGRHPDAVTFTRSLKEDVLRRDFTINALAWHPDTGLVDHVGGIKDLEQGLIRAVGSPAPAWRRTRCASCGRCALQRGWDSILKKTPLTP